MFGLGDFLRVSGFCPICECQVTFKSKQEWLRDHFICPQCQSIPRERALMQTIKTFFPGYKNLAVHESSPGNRGASVKLRKVCQNYTCSHYYQELPPGEIHPKDGIRCENMEALTFQDESFDLFISQDVMEHIFNPEKAFKEIARVLKPGGAHIFTVPLINKEKTSERWASRDNNGRIINHHEPEYHGNPISKKGSLVTMHWGYDIAEFIMLTAGTPTTIVMIDNLELGIRAEYIEVLVSRKMLHQ